MLSDMFGSDYISKMIKGITILVIVDKVARVNVETLVNFMVLLNIQRLSLLIKTIVIDD